MLRKDLPIRNNLMDGTVGGGGAITVYANPIIAAIRTNVTEDPGGTIPPPTIWTPSQISTSLWTSVLNESSVIKSLNIVSQWSDLSGNNRHLTQSNNSLRPVYTANALSSLPSIRFTDDYLDSPSFSLTNYVLVLLAKSNINPNSVIIQYPIGIGTGGVYWGGSFVGNYIGYAGSSVTVSSLYVAQQSVPAIVSIVVDNGVVNIFVNGQNFNGANFTPGITQIRMGYRNDDNWFFGGDISEFVLTPDLNARQKLEGYVAYNYNLQALLSNNHPYRYLPPYA